MRSLPEFLVGISPGVPSCINSYIWGFFQKFIYKLLWNYLEYTQTLLQRIFFRFFFQKALKISRKIISAYLTETTPKSNRCHFSTNCSSKLFYVNHQQILQFHQVFFQKILGKYIFFYFSVIKNINNSSRIFLLFLQDFFRKFLQYFRQLCVIICPGNF